MAGCDDEVENASLRAFLAVLAAQTAPEIWMPAVVDLDLLPNMGRMTPRWSVAAVTCCPEDMSAPSTPSGGLVPRG